jgi:uncharacterized protein YbjT (DUF2867 family)
MKILIYGASGMVGQGVLRECLSAADVSQVVVIGRTAIERTAPKLEQVVLADIGDLQPIESQLQGIDACFFCLGVMSSSMTEEAYRRLTYDLTLSVASQLVRLNPKMKFIYVSGAGTDGTEGGRSLWARVKGKTENDLQKLPFEGVFLFRPGIIQPLDGIKSKTPSYRIFYSIAKPLLPIARMLFPNQILTTRDMGNAMLNAVRSRNGRAILEASDIAQLARN